MIDVMIADDNIEFSKSLCNILTKEEDIKIINISTNGLEALISYTSMHPDILILDLNMPGLSGLDFINNLDKTNQKQNIIIMSGSDEYRALLSDVTLIKYIFKKPFDEHKLIETIREIKNDINSDLELNNIINELLEFLDFNMYSKGTLLLIDSIKLAYYNPKLIIKTENLMKEIAKKHNCSNFKSIRSTIDKSILSMYENDQNLKKICKVFPDFYGYKPSVKSFISHSVSYINKKI